MVCSQLHPGRLQCASYLLSIVSPLVLVAPFELDPTGSPGALVVVGSEFSPYLGGVLVWSKPVLFPPSFRLIDGPAHTSPVGTYLGTCRLGRRHGAVLTREARHLDRVHTKPADATAAHVDHLPVASM
jgi:hypothetical protein